MRVKSFTRRSIRAACLALVMAAAAGWPTSVRSDEPILLGEAVTSSEGGRGRQAFESEHRPVALRRYGLITGGPFGDPLAALVRHPDGRLAEVRIEKGAETVAAFATPMGDGPMHGVHTLYVMDRQVIDRRLIVRVAKWHTVHHSCGWGHDYKFDAHLIRAHGLSSIPLEITCQGLWDRNLHASLSSGDTLRCEVLHFGKPVPNASIRMTSGRGWTSEKRTAADGGAGFQLIGDYYPRSWEAFDRRHRERFTLVAQHEVSEEGRYAGREYDRIIYITSLPWTYTPSRMAYTSYLAGLTIGAVALIMAVCGIFIHRQRRTRTYTRVVIDERN